AREHHVRPIVGCELSMEDGTTLPVLIRSRTGYANLCGLLTTAHLRSEKGACAIQWNELPQYAQGMVALCGAATALQRSAPTTKSASPDSAARLRFLMDSFGHDHVFFEVQRHFLRGEDRVNR